MINGHAPDVLVVNDPGAFDDNVWFSNNPSRLTRIRNPFPNEYEREFNSLGAHDKNRRRILTWRMLAMGPNVLGRIPMIAYADETIENEDAILVPMLDELMRSQAAKSIN
jgi:hypothetical protein